MCVTGFIILLCRLCQTLHIIKRPPVFPFKYYSYISVSARARYIAELLEYFAKLGNFSEHTCVLVSAMVNNCTVHFLAAASALSPLKVLNRIRPVCNCLQ